MNRIKTRLCEEMGYSHAVMFDMARSGIAAWCKLMAYPPVTLPTNICPALPAAFLGCGMTLKWEGGTAVTVQQYGLRAINPGCVLEIDPLMTGCRSATGRNSPFANSCVISFGYSKTIDIGGGGAFFTNDAKSAKEMERFSNFHDRHTERLRHALDRLGQTIGQKRDKEVLWHRALGRMLDPVVPWRFIKTIPHRNAVVARLRLSGHDAGTNYPPLWERFKGFRRFFDERAFSWGMGVINLWLTNDYTPERINHAADIIKRTIDRYESDRQHRGHPVTKQHQLDEHHAHRHEARAE